MNYIFYLHLNDLMDVAVVIHVI